MIIQPNSDEGNKKSLLKLPGNCNVVRPKNSFKLAESRLIGFNRASASEYTQEFDIPGILNLHLEINGSSSLVLFKNFFQFL